MGELRAPILSVDHADKLILDVDLPPDTAEGWKRVELIGATRTGIGSGASRTWYRFELEKPTDADSNRYSLYFWRHNMSLTVFMNGREIGGDMFRDGVETMAWNHPLLVEIQSSNWQPGLNTFHIRFNPSPFGGTFTPVKFGYDRDLRPVYQQGYFRKVRVNEYLLVFGVVVSLATLLLYLVRRKDSVYLWFFGVSVCWCILLTHFVIYFNPVPYQFWLPLVHAAVDTWILCLFGFINRLLDFRSRRMEMAMVAVWGLAICSHAFSPREYFWLLSYCFHLILTLGIAVVFLRVLFAAVVRRNGLAIAVMSAVFGHILMSAYDYWLFFGASKEQWETASQLSQFGVPLILAVFLVSLLHRFRQALDDSERLNAELEQRVDATRDALEASYARNRDLELRRAASEERQKIYRDLHDDVGSKLLTIMREEPESPVVSMASSALESLREAVYRANYQDEPFLDFLTTVREETKLRAAGQGFSCNWFEDPDLPNQVIKAKTAYHLGRILREAVTNTLNHSGGTSFSVSIELPDPTSEMLYFELVDDGVGGVVPENGRTSGVRNIRQRAEMIGAEVSWGKADEGGMKLMLLVPSLAEAAIR